MLSFAKNDRGIRMASAAILLAPVAWLIISYSHSATVDLIVGVLWCVLALTGTIGFLYERAEEEVSSAKR